MSASWSRTRSLYLKFGIKCHKRQYLKLLNIYPSLERLFSNTAARYKKEKKGYESISYDFVTPPGEKKETSCPLPQTYSPRYVEAAWYDWWVGQGFFRPTSQTGEPDKKFVLCLPPPNVTGTLHLGHALTCAIQDALVRWHRMHGYETVWIPGCDHAGIATQVVVEKRLWEETGKTRHDLGRDKFLDEIWKWKNEKGDKIFDQLKKLGFSLDWTRTAFTMDEKLSKAVIEAFVRLFDDGLIYRSDRLVNWSCQLKSAISDIEVDTTSVSGRCEIPVPGYIKPVTFGLMESFDYPVVNSDERITISTTRLETMLGDTAVAVHPDDERYKHLHGKFVRHPLDNRELPIVCDEFVERDFGTGAVKITPAHDFTDYDVGVRHDLPFLTVIDETGCMVNVQEQFQGLKRFDARSKVREALEQRGMYRGSEDHSMVIPLCSRSKDVIEPLLKPQWYIRCKDMNQKAIQAVENGELTLTPDFYKKIWNEWLKSNKDWCISRQLWWGHRIPAYRVTLNSQPMKGEVWVAGRDRSEALSRAAEKLNVDKNDIILHQDDDVLDTWFSSALFPFSVHGWPLQTVDLSQYYPCSLMETGHDILFFWVVRMVIMGQILTGQLPFSKVLLHGTLRDAHGRKMSKSLGNVIDPMDVVYGVSLEELNKQLDNSLLSKDEVKKAKQGQKQDYPNGIPECGADALRFALCSYDFKCSEISMNVIHVKSYRHFCNKIWQGFSLANSKLGTTFKPNNDFKSVIVEGVVNQWILSRLSHMVRSCDQYIQSYDLHFSTQSLYNFWFQDFCDLYLESIKPVFQSGSTQQQLETQEVLHHCIDTFLRATSPFMPFLTEELFQRLPGRGDNWPESICIAQYPRPEDYQYDSPEVEKEVEIVRSLWNTVLSMVQQGGVERKQANVYIKSTALDLSQYVPLISVLTKVKDVAMVTDITEVPEGCQTSKVSDDIWIAVKGFFDVERELQRLDKKVEALKDRIAQHENALAKYEKKGKQSKRKQDVLEKMHKSQLELEELQKKVENLRLTSSNVQNSSEETSDSMKSF